MGIFVSTTDEIDVYWINELLLIAPEGPRLRAEMELIFNGLVRPRKKGAKLIFVHRGEIYKLENRSGEWQNAVSEPLHDWFVASILQHRGLSKDHEIIKTKRKGKIFIRYTRQNDPVEATVVPAELTEGLSDIDICCSGENRKHLLKEMPSKSLFDEKCPLFSYFSLAFEQRETQLFRISFRTKFNIRDYSSQIAVKVEGPHLMKDKILRDIRNHITTNDRRRSILQQKIIGLFNSIKEPYCCNVALISHPFMPLTIEDCQNITKPKYFQIESAKTPVRSAASGAKMVFFYAPSKKFSFCAIANIPYRAEQKAFSAKFLYNLERLKQHLADRKKRSKP